MTFRLHREGNTILLVSALILLAINLGVSYLGVPPSVSWALGIISVGFYGIIVQFFRNPVRTIKVTDESLVYAPADGKVVVIEEADEPEYFGARRLQVSIFMSPTNVHVNRNPIGGIVKYVKYHAGKYLVAWHPKASTENERTTVVIGNSKGEVLFRQIAGALAKRIKYYVTEGDKVEQGGEMGFIKFGSRVDLYLPLDAIVEVQLEQKVRGNETIIARLQ